MDARLTLVPAEPGPVIHPALHGQFAEHVGAGIYGGIWVGEESPIPNTRGLRNDVVVALQALRIPVLRWPGGCFADEYDWRDGIGPRERRPQRTNRSWGGAVESNAFGTHEFMDLAGLLGAAAYINGNVGSGSPRQLADWMEYLTGDSESEPAALRRRNGRAKPWTIPYFGFGNEPWGCGGQMTPARYAQEYRQFAALVHSADETSGWKIAAGAAGDDPTWTEVLMADAGRYFDALSVHYYTLPTGDWNAKGPATGFGEDGWISTLWRALQLDDILRTHGAIMDSTDPERRVALVADEWGTWYDPEPGDEPSALRQQNTLRDALTAAISLNVLHAHSDRVRMANIAQLVNVLQAMVMTRGERMVLTPSYHVFSMYRVFQAATSLRYELECGDYRLGDIHVPALAASVAVDAAGGLHAALVNLHPGEPLTLRVHVQGDRPEPAAGCTLTAAEMDGRNTFEEPHHVQPTPFDAFRAEGDDLIVELAPKSVTVLSLGITGGNARVD
jgi:alpha-N-arabinofuranosidase